MRADEAPVLKKKPAKNKEEKKLTIGETAPSFALKTMNPELCGTSNVSYKTYFGSRATRKIKVMVISFASAHCKPCKKELPELHKMYLELKDKGLEVLAVSMDKEAEDIEVMNKLTAEHKFTFPVLTDRFTILARRYHANELPYIILLDGEGIVRWTKVGYSGEDALDQLRKAMEPYLPGTDEGAPAGNGAEEKK